MCSKVGQWEYSYCPDCLQRYDRATDGWNAREWAARYLTLNPRRIIALCAILGALWAGGWLGGCAAIPEDEWVGWRVDLPAFRMARLQWVTVEGRERLANLCASRATERWNVVRSSGGACAYRIEPDGTCLVYSIYSETQAHWIPGDRSHSLWQHEVNGHCGGGFGPGRAHE